MKKKYYNYYNNTNKNKTSETIMTKNQIFYLTGIIMQQNSKA